LYTIFNTPLPHGTGTLAKKEAIRYRFNTMATLVIKSFPEELHAKLKAMAAAHRRSVTQETIHLLETALTFEEEAPSPGSNQSKWANRKTLPEYDAMLASGAFSGGTDSTVIISEERDAR
jgi:plasmid stability protein